jgi:nucleoside-diphosphate-sugar epimerase
MTLVIQKQPSDTPAVMRVLVTGASGAIGQPVCAELRARGDFVRGFDRTDLGGSEASDEFVTGDLADAARVKDAIDGMDGIVHLAAMPDEAPFAELVSPNLLGLFHVFDAARHHRVRRVVLASSVQAVSGAGAGVRGTSLRVPNNHYALTKLFAEDMGEMYARRFNLQVVAARIGWMVRTPREAERIQELALLGWYVSRGDVSRFLHGALHSEFQGFATAYVIGPDGREHFDLEPGRRLFGFEPCDRFPEGLPFEVPSRGPAG